MGKNWLVFFQSQAFNFFLGPFLKEKKFDDDDNRFCASSSDQKIDKITVCQKKWIPIFTKGGE